MKKTFFIFLLLLASLFSFACEPITLQYHATPTPTPTPCPGGGIIGNQSNAGGFTSIASAIYLDRYSAPMSGNITSIVFEPNTIGSQYQLGVYADNGSGTAPTSLLGKTEVLTVTRTGTSVNTISPYAPVVNGNYYWLAITCTGEISRAETIGTVCTVLTMPFPATASPLYYLGSGAQFSLVGTICP